LEVFLDSAKSAAPLRQHRKERSVFKKQHECACSDYRKYHNTNYHKSSTKFDKALHQK
jgi:hypothetical protein